MTEEKNETVGESVETTLRLILLGAGGRLFVGRTRLKDHHLQLNVAYKFEGVRQLISFEQQVQTPQGVGIRQANQILPMATCEGPVDMWIRAEFWVWPDEDARASKKLLDLMEQIEKAEMMSRLNEMGIIAPGGPQRL